MSSKLTVVIFCILIGGYFAVKSSTNEEVYFDEPLVAAVKTHDIEPPSSAAVVVKDVTTVLVKEEISSCIDDLQKIDSSRFLVEQRKALLKNRFSTLPSVARTPQNLAEMAQIAGLERIEGVQFMPRFVASEKPAVLRRSLDAKRISTTAAVQLIKSIRSSDYHLIGQAIEAGELSVFDYLLNKSLLSTIIEQGKNLSDENLELILASGIEVNLSDLVEATEAGYEQQMLAVLMRHSQVKANQVWQHQSRSNSLASVAISALNDSALTFWLEQQSPIYSQVKKLNGLAFLPIPKNQAEQDKALAIVQLLVAQGVETMSQMTRFKLSKWLPDEAKHYLDLPESSSISLSAELLLFAEKLKEDVAQLDDLIEKSKALELSCHAKMAENVGDETPIQDDLFSKQDQAEFGVDYSPQQARKKYIDALEKITQIDVKQALLTGTDELTKAVFTGKWNLAIDKAEQLQNEFGTQDKEYLDMLLIQAFMAKAPFEVLKRILDKGATLSEASILMLATVNNVTLIEQLLPYGLNIHYTDPKGRNALSYSVLSASSVEVFYFLANRGVSVKPSIKGLDPLDLALQGYKRSDKAIDYIVHLIKLDAPIQTSQVQQVRLLQLSHPKKYQQIEQRAAALTSSL